MTRALLVMIALAGCAGARPTTSARPNIPFTVDALLADSIAHAMVQRAFDADVKGRNPDSLYIADAEVVANGMPKAEAPRIAGVGADGAVQLGSSRFAVTGNYVWGTMQYRWLPPGGERKMTDGWATFVIARLKGGEWRILHVHSSTARGDSV